MKDKKNKYIIGEDAVLLASWLKDNNISAEEIVKSSSVKPRSAWGFRISVRKKRIKREKIISFLQKKLNVFQSKNEELKKQQIN